VRAVAKAYVNAKKQKNHVFLLAKMMDEIPDKIPKLPSFYL
jgi:hypothetical protein